MPLYSHQLQLELLYFQVIWFAWKRHLDSRMKWFGQTLEGAKNPCFWVESLFSCFLSGLHSNISLCDLSRWQFQRHIKKSEGLKIPKVELQISIYGVKILDPKTKVSCCTRQVKLYCQQTRHSDRCNLPSASIQSVNNECGVFVYQDVQHNCQLHRISFCADDKTDKRIFTFICKDSESNKHLCYVFDSEKCVSVFCIFVSSLKQNVWNTVCWLIHLCSYIILWFVCFDCSHLKNHVVNRQRSDCECPVLILKFMTRRLLPRHRQKRLL